MGDEKSVYSESIASTASRRVTRSGIVVSQILSKGIPPRAHASRKMGEDIKYTAPASTDPNQLRSESEVIDAHRCAFPADPVTGKETDAPQIPMCRLVHLEFVRP